MSTAGKFTTERHILDLLVQRYSVVSQGSSVRYAYAEHVRSCAGFYARRTADFMAVDLWPSSGLHLHGHEVKVSRSDWLRELADPSKAEEFKKFCDRWWLVVSDRAIVKPGELPAGWGLMAPSGWGLRVFTPAPVLSPEPLPRTMFAAFSHAVAKTARRAAVSADLLGAQGNTAYDGSGSQGAETPGEPGPSEALDNGRTCIE